MRAIVQRWGIERPLGAELATTVLATTVPARPVLVRPVLAPSAG
ncbi:MAG: hypothetical protein ACLPUO_06760 [Streptosporangiaceae bacterium]